MKLLINIPKTVYFIAALIGGFFCLVVLAVAVGSSQSYRQFALGGSRPDKMEVIIQNPQFDSQFSLGTLVLVEASADGPNPILSMELWVDGNQVGPPQTLGEFYWPADAPDDHTLIVRATDTQGSTATSAPLQLEIVGTDELAPGAAAAAYVPHSQGVGPAAPGPGAQPEAPALPEPPPLPEPPQTDPNAENGSPWKFGVFDWLIYVLSDPDPPKAPGLAGPGITGCKVRIWIGDNSDNELGFYVYRSDPGTANFTNIATLDANVGPTFTFEDHDLSSGVYDYKVSAFNKGGESDSNPLQAEVDSPNCPPKIKIGLSVALINLQLPQFDFQIDTLYGYYSFDKVNWQKTKDIYPDQDGKLPNSIPIIKLADLEPGTPFDIEFWGLTGDEPQFLGSMHFEDAKNGEQGPSTELGGGVSGGMQVLDENVFGGPFTDNDTLFETTTDYLIPRPFAWPAFTKSACVQHAGNSFIGGLVCPFYPEDQGYTIWALTEPCPALKYNPSAECFTEQDVLGYKVYDTLINSGVTPAATIKSPPEPPPGQTFYALKNWSACDPRSVSVTALVEVNGDVKESIPSNWVSYAGHPDCGFLQGLEPRWFRLTWDTIDFSVGNIDDGVDLTDDAEGFGYLKLQTQNGFTQYWTMSEMGHFGTYETHGHVFEFEDDADDNPYFWSNIPLTKGTDGPCTWYFLCEINNGYFLQNHQVDFPLFVNDLAFIKVRLWDADDSHPDDVICHIPHVNNPGSFGGISAAAIEAAPNSILSKSIFMGHADASCEVKFHFEPLP